MKNRILFTLVLSMAYISGISQPHSNLIGFSKNDIGFVKYIETHIRYPALALDRGENGIFFTVVYVNRSGELDSVVVLNQNQNAFFPSEIKKAINLTRGLWRKSPDERIIVLPIIYYITGKDQKNGNYLIEMSPNIGNMMANRIAINNCIFFSPIVIPGYDGIRK